MANPVSLTIDGILLSVPAGTLVVDAARKAGVDIPVFCYHPKMEPVGMCRMCLVEVGRPVVDRASGKSVLETDGSPKIAFNPKLETACTTPVSEGMVVRTTTKNVLDARQDVVEFILTSHPLDCPVCDKGGECPLQNTTMAYGPTGSRFLYDEKMHIDKQVPLGELIFLDRERCIQCGRCVRFAGEVVDDPVIGFFHRGRSLEIVTCSEPGFDSIFSGNTTDICPVGALTTADFRFGARPWELKPVASICNHCPVGCNLTLEVRREARSDGKMVVKRVLPRQNERVNQIWICDKGRFAHHHVEDGGRLKQPLMRKDGKLVPVSWDEALDAVAGKICQGGASIASLAGGRLSNEDLFNLHQLTRKQSGKSILYSYMAGGDLAGRFGLRGGSGLVDLGKGDAILLVACDLHEEAPLWWLHVRQAVKRGATLIVANPRPTRLDKDAHHILQYEYGQEADAVEAFLPGALQDSAGAAYQAAQAFQQADNAVILYGSEGLGLSGSLSLVNACARLLLKTGHTSRVRNGLVPVWHNGNLQGAWDMGFRPVQNLADTLEKADLVYVAGADPAGDDPHLARALEKAGFVVVQELHMTETARLADVVFPVSASTEREGTYTSGERRLQRFYPSGNALPDTRADYWIVAQIVQRLGRELPSLSAASVMEQIAAQASGYHGMNYALLAETREQWPPMGKNNLHFAGTACENYQGLGASLQPVDDVCTSIFPLFSGNGSESIGPALSPQTLKVVPVTRLYDRGNLMKFSPLLGKRMVGKILWLHPVTAGILNVAHGESVHLNWEDYSQIVEVILDGSLPQGVGLVPRSTGLPINGPVAVRLMKIVTEAAEEKP